jgi:hypothetical protein
MTVRHQYNGCGYISSEFIRYVTLDTVCCSNHTASRFSSRIVPSSCLLSAAKGYYHAADLEGANLTWADNKTPSDFYKMPVVVCVMARIIHNSLVNNHGIVPKRQ